MDLPSLPPLQVDHKGSYNDNDDDENDHVVDKDEEVMSLVHDNHSNHSTASSSRPAGRMSAMASTAAVKWLCHPPGPLQTHRRRVLLVFSLVLLLLLGWSGGAWRAGQKKRGAKSSSGSGSSSIVTQKKEPSSSSFSNNPATPQSKSPHEVNSPTSTDSLTKSQPEEPTTFNDPAFIFLLVLENGSFHEVDHNLIGHVPVVLLALGNSLSELALLRDFLLEQVAHRDAVPGEVLL